jgi:hypothetical protein
MERKSKEMERRCVHIGKPKQGGDWVKGCSAGHRILAELQKPRDQWGKGRQEAEPGLGEKLPQVAGPLVWPQDKGSHQRKGISHADAVPDFTQRVQTALTAVEDWQI